MTTDTDNEIISELLGELAAYKTGLPVLLKSLRDKGFTGENPISHLRPTQDLSALLGREMKFEPARFNEDFDNVILEVGKLLSDVCGIGE